MITERLRQTFFHRSSPMYCKVIHPTLEHHGQKWFPTKSFHNKYSRGWHVVAINIYGFVIHQWCAEMKRLISEGSRRDCHGFLEQLSETKPDLAAINR